MRALRPRREAFVRHVFLSPKTGWSQARCYEASGYKTSGHASEANASRLLQFAEVKMRLQEMGKPVTKRAQITLEALLAELDRTIADARQDRQHSAVVAALGLITRIAQMLHERADAEPEFAGALTSDDIADRIVEEMGVDNVRDLAQQLLTRATKAAGDRALLVKSKPKRRRVKRAVGNDASNGKSAQDNVSQDQ
jgi:hypothetical protein